jgi:hypothetical protein
MPSSIFLDSKTVVLPYYVLTDTSFTVYDIQVLEIFTNITRMREKE